MKRISSLAVSGALALGIVTSANAAPVKLAYKFKKGDVTRYNVSMDAKITLPKIPGMPTQGEPMSFSMSLMQVQKVMDVYPDGSAKLKVWSGNISARAAGVPNAGSLPIDQFPDTTSYVKMSKLGTVLNVEIPKPATGSKRGKSGAMALPALPIGDMPLPKMMSQFGDYFAFPAGPVDVGTVWEKPVVLPMNIGTLKLSNSVDSTSEQYAGVETAKIVQKLSGQISIDQAIKAFTAVLGSGLAQMSGGRGGGINMPNITGTADVSGTSNTYFCPATGTKIGQKADAAVMVNLNLPQEMAKEGVPANIKIGLDFSFTMTKI